MSAVSYNEKTFAGASKARSATSRSVGAADAPKSFFGRLKEAAVAAHTQQIEREYLRYFEINGHDPVIY